MFYLLLLAGYIAFLYTIEKIFSLKKDWYLRALIYTFGLGFVAFVIVVIYAIAS